MCYTYILQSAKNLRYYIGHSEDIGARLIRHNSGMVKATRNKGPWVLVYFEEFMTRTEANKRELEFKSRKCRKYIEKLIVDGGTGRHVPT